MRQLIFTAQLPSTGVFGRDLSPLNYRRYLGQTLSSLAWDASGGLFPNAFAALAGTLQDNKNLSLLLPLSYPAGDPDHLRLLDFGSDQQQCRHFFNARLRHFAAKLPASDPHRAEQSSLTYRCTPQIFLGKRGRGKTTALGEKITWLSRQTQGNILIVTPFRSNLQRLREMLPVEKKYIFLPPDDALYRRPAAEFLIVDEASVIPPAQLYALTAHYPAFTLAATTEGYEGTGQEFALKTLPALLERHPLTEIIYQHQNKRYAENDPLEWVLENAFLLSPPAIESTFPTTIFAVSRERLACDEHLLRQIYTLLTQAHYRTSPEDLKRLLDLPHQSLFVASDGQNVAGVVHILQESPLPLALAQAVRDGSRRPQGRLLLQQLLQKTGDLSFNRPLNRISRLAVHPSQRRKGIAAALLAFARANLTGDLGVSYGHSEELAAFWQSQGFIEYHRAGRGKNRLTSLRIKQMLS